MPTDTTVQRNAQPGLRGDMQVSETAHEYMTLVQTLTTDQVRCLDQILAPLDRATTGVRIGFFSARANDRNGLMDYVVRPVAARKVRTQEHRKVVGLRIDASALPEGVQPWHSLLMHVIELLTESALPNERLALNELRNELNRVMRTTQRDSAGNSQIAVTFVRRFMMAFPRLVVQTVSMLNSVLMIVIDQLELTDADAISQWLEATQYFCNVQHCAVVLTANEKALVEKLNQNVANADGVGILQKWMTKRVEFAAAPITVRPLTVNVPGIEDTPKSNSRDRRSSQPAELPSSCAHIILEALQPNSAAIDAARAQWRVAMHTLSRRAAEGLSGNIPATIIAKLVALRGVASPLFDAARYDAQMLTIIEKSALGDTSNDMYAEWVSQVGRHPRLASLLATEPAFSSIDLRDLATALRVTSSQEVLAATPEKAMSLPVEVKTSLLPVINMQTLRNTAHQAEGQIQNATPVMVAGFAGACVFIVDRFVKLLIQSSVLQPGESLLGGLIQPAFHSPNAVVGGLWGEGAAVGAELFGLVLALMIMFFWGATRKQRSYSISMGLIIGGMTTNLFDRLVYGGVFNYVHLANLPVFNLAHLALFVGGLMLAFSVLRGQRTTDILVIEEGTTGTN